MISFFVSIFILISLMFVIFTGIAMINYTNNFVPLFLGLLTFIFVNTGVITLSLWISK